MKIASTIRYFTQKSPSFTTIASRFRHRVTMNISKNRARKLSEIL